MSALDGSIVIIALPAIFRGIGLDPLAPGQHRLPAVDDPGLPAGLGGARGRRSGRLGDMFGRVKMYNLGFVIFSAASVALSFDPFHGRQRARCG